MIKEEVEKDDRSRKRMAELEKNEGVGNYFMQHRMLRYKGRLVILKNSTIIPTILHISRFCIWRTFRVLENLQKTDWRVVLGRDEAGCLEIL